MWPHKTNRVSCPASELYEGSGRNALRPPHINPLACAAVEAGLILALHHRYAARPGMKTNLRDALPRTRCMPR